MIHAVLSFTAFMATNGLVSAHWRGRACVLKGPRARTEPIVIFDDANAGDRPRLARYERDIVARLPQPTSNPETAPMTYGAAWARAAKSRRSRE